MSARAAPIQKYLFERSFDDPNRIYMPGERFGPPKEDKQKPRAAEADDADLAESDEAAEDAPPPEPVEEAKYTESQLEAAKEEGYIAGHTAALEEAETAREHYVADAISLISKSIDSLEESQREANREIGETALRMVYAVVRKILPTAVQNSAIEGVEELLKDVLPLVFTQPTLVVRTHAMISEQVQSRLDALVERTNFNGKISVVVDYELQPGDCRVEWEGGGADRNEARMWHDIREVVAYAVGDVDVDALDKDADAFAAEETSEVEPADNDTPDDASDKAAISADSESHAETAQNDEVQDDAADVDGSPEGETETAEEPSQPT